MDLNNILKIKPDTLYQNKYLNSMKQRAISIINQSKIELIEWMKKSINQVNRNKQN